jgi:hypothetical protein
MSMHCLKVIVLMSLVFLSGCKEEFAVLEFDVPVEQRQVVSAQAYISVDYREMLRERLTAHGIDLNRIELTKDKGNSKILNVVFPYGSMSVPQREQIKAVLTDIISSRTHWKFKANLQPHWNTLNLTSEAGRQLALEISQQMTLESADPFKVILAGKATFDSVISTLLDNKVSQEFFCHVELKLQNAIPFASIISVDAFDPPEGVTGNVMLKKIMPGNSAYKVPATFYVEDDNMRRTIKEKKLVISNSVLPDGNDVKALSFEVGSLGEQASRGGKLSGSSYHRLEKQCMEMAGNLGRPFSFQFGNGLDRLNKVTFL